MARSDADHPPRAEPAERAARLREAWVAGLGILLFLGVLKHVGAVVPFVGRHAFTIAAGAQLYVPILLIGRRGITRDSLGLSLDCVRADLRAVSILALVVTVPFALGHHLWQTILFHRPFALRLPEDLLVGVVTQILVVALAEELFFRGYLQERLEGVWPSTRSLLGLRWGAAVVVASAVFALAHFVGEYRLDRLGPFFPGLVFGMLRARSGTIVGAVGFHAYCNVLGDVLFASYRSSR